MFSALAQAQTVNEQVEAAVTKNLNKAVAKYARSLGSQSYNVQLVALPPLKLSLCTHEPDVRAIGSSEKITSRMTRKVTCHTPDWSLNIRAEIKIFKQVVKSVNKIERNRRISPVDITLESENILKIRGPYFSHLQQVAGLNSRRQISSGKVIQPAMTIQPKMVERNKTVRIQAGRNGFRVSMKGQALESGSLGDQIQVRNVSSGKVITAEVTGQGVVSQGSAR
ncbi:flagellar basal body P-ring formation chaperone FlgA [Sansalvadorimonas verongulae]|uniref:flagellar basal body P-ring formation chaperone FlgA n=1 Tax=Sansalvadorimonas verongulae TaxID=2172824 RepID=UPI0018AD1E37|nr:flagellar basal body P-ring formation chaperone FlgA [Sansalvadorimonas verongulae]